MKIQPKTLVCITCPYNSIHSLKHREQVICQAEICPARHPDIKQISPMTFQDLMPFVDIVNPDELFFERMIKTFGD